jgi:NADH-quinone oxidoreductase subunit G
VGGLIGDRVSNEDAWLFGKLFCEGFNSTQIANRPHAAGLDLAARYGVGAGTSLGALGKDDVVLIVAADVEETAPVYMLRLKAAAERGTKLIVANARETKLDRYAAISIGISRVRTRRRFTVCSLRLIRIGNQRSSCEVCVV